MHRYFVSFEDLSTFTSFRSVHFLCGDSIKYTIMHIQILGLQINIQKIKGEKYNFPFIFTTLSFKTSIQFILIGMTSTKTCKPFWSRIMKTFRCECIFVGRFEKTHLTTNGSTVKITECLRRMLHHGHNVFDGRFISGSCDDRRGGGQSDDKEDLGNLHSKLIDLSFWSL